MSRFTESNNPLLKEDTFKKLPGVIDRNEVTTVSGAINKSLILFGIMMTTTLVSYQMPTTFLMYGGFFAGLIAFFVVLWKPHLAPSVAPAYALFEGLFVGSVSAMYAAMFDGIVFQAISLTFGTLFMMLMLYKTGVIKVTEKLKAGVMMATGAIMLVYIFSFVGSFVGMTVPYLHDSGPIGIGISVVIIGVAALNLLLDFDLFEKAEKEGAPKYMEWFCGMALLVTLVWLYIEFLRLLAKLKE